MFPYSSLSSASQKILKRLFLDSGLLCHYDIQFGCYPWVNTLCRSTQDWRGLERGWVFICICIKMIVCVCIHHSGYDLEELPHPSLDGLLFQLCLLFSPLKAGLPHLSLIHFTLTFIFQAYCWFSYVEQVMSETRAETHHVWAAAWISPFTFSAPDTLHYQRHENEQWSSVSYIFLRGFWLRLCHNRYFQTAPVALTLYIFQATLQLVFWPEQTLFFMRQTHRDRQSESVKD